MPRATIAANLREFLTVGEAARLLGVSPGTLRNWDRKNKLKSVRHPVNGYRLYRREDLDTFLRRLRPGPEGHAAKRKS